jgi:soluble lytic murein transglycosylase
MINPRAGLLYTTFIVISFAINTVNASSSAPPNPPFAGTSEQQEQFKNAYQTLTDKNIKANDIDFKALSKGLESSVLYPYLQYRWLIKQDSANDTALLIFLKRYPESVLSVKIREKWLARLAEQQRWARILDYYLPQQSSKINDCFYYEAQLHLNGNKNPEIIQQAKQHWSINRDLPGKCTGLVETLRPYLQAEDYWQRIAKTMPQNRVTLSKRLAKHLPPDQQATFATWVAVHQDPQKNLANIIEETPRNQQIIIAGLQRLAKKAWEDAENRWLFYKAQWQFGDQHIADIENTLYSRAAKKGDVLDQAQTLEKLKQIPAQFRNDEASIWMARLAIQQKQWSLILQAVESMSEEEQNDGRWVYWQAYAHDKLKQKDQAKALFAQIATKATYHGFLAADYLQQPYAALHTEKPNRNAELNKVRELRNLQRALALYEIGYHSLALKEWLFTIKQLDNPHKLAAAEFALKHGQAFTSILTVAKTKDWNAIDLRFPLLHRELVEQHSRQQQVEPSWVYGVMRRESAFKIDALSRVKAFGLMQLMPATAREVSRSLKLTGLNREDYVKPEINIQLGSHYLAKMLAKFNGSYPKATAAYNAGPGRIPRWTPDNPQPAEQWIESIPFEETRQYVQAVLTYTIIYDHLLKQGKTHARLSQYLTPISP